ncbi:unnamed protein product [Soboliphyme baturini]|uniref:Thioredoxin domain-containing protein n=1 Tax=Soboliphyme baturini TaxID=241478 RepID=A0A183IFC0_9BILA|nr:unnamed protein product [Soboliphyme baturini]
MSISRWKEELGRIASFHHVFNIILCLSFYFTKTVPPICRLLYGSDVKCGINEREYQVLLLLAVIIYSKNRRATSWVHYLSNVFLFTKVANMVLFYWCGAQYCILYGICILVVWVLFPEPAYTGPETISYLPGPVLKEEIENNKDVIWLVEFYSTWSSMCHHFVPVFAELSNQYSLKNLRFAKLDVCRYKNEAIFFGVNCQSDSRQLPTLILFQDGKEKLRRPVAGGSGRSFTYVFTKAYEG